MKYADLHVHTDFSDGTFSPERVVEEALKQNLSSIAICDHDCIDGIEPAIKAAENTDLEIIPSVEITVIRGGKEIHILGYFIDLHNAEFTSLLRRVQHERIERVKKMIKKLQHYEVKLDFDKVMEIAGGKGSVGRLHVAQALVATKAVPSIFDAFNLYIGDFKPCYVKDIGFALDEAVHVITKAKGFPVLAHPYILHNDELIKDFIKLGVRGIEAYHSDCSARIGQKYEKMAERLGVIATGGSDCHGMGKGRVLMGRVKIPYTYVEKLKKAYEESGIS